MSRRQRHTSFLPKHLGLAVEVALAVVPVTLVGGFYVLLGIYFGTVSLIVSILHGAVSGWWLGVLALALGGLFGIVGLWLLVLSAVKDVAPITRTRAFAAALVGIVTTVAALALSMRDGAAPLDTWMVYVLVSPIVFVSHRALADWTARRDSAP